MPILKVGFNNTTGVATVLDSDGDIPVGSVEVGTFEHPDATYPDSLVIYHGVQDILYKRSKANPANAGFWPDNITNMQSVEIDFQGTPRLLIATELPRIISTIEGKDVFWHVDAAGGKPPYTYAWSFKANTEGADYVIIDPLVNESANTATLTIPTVTVESAGLYKVVVTDANGTTAESISELAVGAVPAE